MSRHRAVIPAYNTANIALSYFLPGRWNNARLQPFQKSLTPCYLATPVAGLGSGAWALGMLAASQGALPPCEHTDSGGHQPEMYSKTLSETEV
jgi:hypothetical protein